MTFWTHWGNLLFLSLEVRWDDWRQQKRKSQLTFEFQNSRVFEKRSKTYSLIQCLYDVSYVARLVGLIKLHVDPF